MRRALVLFDVDGTLLISGGATSRCIHRAARRVLGERYREGTITAGRLDPEIFADLARQCGVEDAASNLEPYKQLYLTELESELQRVIAEVKVLPGVREVLAELSGREDVVLGLLTGNFGRAVELKLSAAGLDAAQFRILAVAEDGRRRADLVGHARRRFEEVFGEPIAPRQVIIVGDTPRDISCAREAGCRVVAVATGRYSLAELEAEGPDAAVRTLEDREALLRLIEQVVRGDPSLCPG
jgi:phosphoglycolate phosphatase